MILKELRAINFKSLRDETVKFEKGVTLIRGLNESGKSTIMEAILYALYTYVLRPTTNPAHAKLIEHNSSRAFVQLTFQIGDRTFQVTREIFRSSKRSSKSRIDEILPNRKSKPLGVQSVTKVNETVMQLMGDISYHELVSSCIVAQKELGKLVELRAGKRKDIINVFLNLEHFNKILDRVKDIRRILLGKREAGGGKIDSEENKKETLLQARDQFDEFMGEKNEKIISVEDLKKQLKSTRAELDEKQSLLKRLEKYDDAREKQDSINGEIESIKKQIDIHEKRLDKLADLETERKEIQADFDELEYIRSATPEIPQIEEAKSSYEGLEQELRIVTQSEAKQKNGWQKEKKEAENLKPTTHEQEIISSSINLRMIGVSALFTVICLILGVSINQLLILGSIPFVIIMVYLLYRYLRKLSLSEKNLKYLKQKERQKAQWDSLLDIREEITRINGELEAEIDSIEPKISKLPSELKPEHAELNIDVISDILEKYEDTAEKRKNLHSRIKQIDEQLDEKPEIQTEISSLEREKDKKQDELTEVIFPELPKSIEFSKELLENTQDEVTSLTARAAGLKQEIKGLKIRIGELEEYLRDHEGVHEKYNEQVAKVKHLIEEAEVSGIVKEALEETSRNLRQRVRPSVERHMQQILPVITDNRYKAVRLVDDYNLEVWSEDAGEFQEKEMFSGGTEDQFLLAMRIAFALSLLPFRKYVKPDFLFLDEPLGSSDMIRREGIMNLTNTVLSESFEQIIIISHVEGLEEYIDHIIEVEDGQVRSTQ